MHSVVGGVGMGLWLGAALVERRPQVLHSHKERLVFIVSEDGISRESMLRIGSKCDEMFWLDA